MTGKKWEEDGEEEAERLGNFK